MNRLFRISVLAALAAALAAGGILPVHAESEPEVTIRVSNWEEYIDLGGWDEEETIDLDSGDIIGVNPMVEDFEEWYRETYGIRVNVEYSTFGTNEDLYNMLTLGDVYDCVCPSEYMIMKLKKEGELQPFSEAFFDEEDEFNYYSRGVSPYIREMFETNEIDGEPWSQYAAGYMWGVTGIVYNPEFVTEEEASTWHILENEKFRKRITVKDNVRDTYFAALGALKSDLLTSEEFLNDPDYHQRLAEEMNDTSPETIAAAEAYLKKVKENAYSFETDSGKADMVTKKVVANFQWSGDGAYSMDQYEDDELKLYFSVPEEVTNIYFDGWVLLKKGIGGDEAKQHACEAFINFISRPDNVIRNMYYVGYSSVITGGEDERIFEYLDWSYGEEGDDCVDYPLGYFFSGDEDDEDYMISASPDSYKRQLGSLYPGMDVLARSAIMEHFDEDASADINRMWVNVRCLKVTDLPVWCFVLTGAAVAGFVFLAVRPHRKAGKKRRGKEKDGR